MKAVTRRQLAALAFLLTLSALIGVSVYYCATDRVQPMPSFYLRTSPKPTPHRAAGSGPAHAARCTARNLTLAFGPLASTPPPGVSNS